MRSRKPGSATSVVEVMQVSNRGLWLYLTETKREYYMSFEYFPWFRDATVQQLSAIELERKHILRWTELDVDLDLNRIDQPQKYPLVSQSSSRLLGVSDSHKPVRKKAATRAPRIS